MKVVIIEDEAFAALRLKKMIQAYNPAIEILAELESVAESVKWFKLKSIDYLLKPIVHEELAAALKKYEQFQGLHQSSVDLPSLYKLLTTNSPAFRTRFSISVGTKIKIIEVEDIAYFFVMDKGVYLRTFEGSTFTIDFTLDKLEGMVSPASFFRINRKYVVNIASIKNMVAYSRGRIKLELHPEADEAFDTIVSIDRSGEFKKWLNN